MRYLLSLFLMTLFVSVQAQYEFKPVKNIGCTSIKSQDNTGTCWSFSTVSFLESELIRMGKEPIDLSEMFLVRTTYKDKAQNYLLRQGKAQFSQGGLAHDVLNAYAIGGIVPESFYPGKRDEKGKLNHSRLAKKMKEKLDGWIASKSVPEDWRAQIDAILDEELGAVPASFEYNGEEFTVESFTKMLDIQPGVYKTFTSFTHHPFYSNFILEIPDNYSNGMYYNVPLEKLSKIVDAALDMGYSVAWDGDVSENGFSARKGIAVLPVGNAPDDVFATPVKEQDVTPEIRQIAFENYSTTDDHLMHIVGKAKDQNGTEYYIIKNSWGEISPYKGYLYMSKKYFDMKTVAITLHGDGVDGYLIGEEGR